MVPPRYCLILFPENEDQDISMFACYVPGSRDVGFQCFVYSTLATNNWYQKFSTEVRIARRLDCDFHSYNICCGGLISFINPAEVLCRTEWFPG